MSPIFQALLAFDEVLFELIHSEWRHPALDFLMPLISNKWNWALPIVGFHLYSLGRDRKKGVLLMLSALLLVAVTDVTATRLKGAFLRLRPQRPVSDMALIEARPASSSFPSNHAVNAFALATLYCAYHSSFCGVFLAAAALVAYSRIYLGAHYPLDVVAGATLGIALAYLFVRASRSLKKWRGSFDS
jgi:undecaprenyl-diphosphatase